MNRGGKAAKLRVVPKHATARDCLVSSEAMNDADLKLSQIRAIADLIGTVDSEMLYEDTVALATHTICDLVTEVIELTGTREHAPDASEGQS